MSILCPNCKTKLSCGCQKRTASNGATVCTSCLPAYEAQLKNKINTKASTDPSHINIIFNGIKR